MIRNYQPKDLTQILSLWLETNIAAHSFVPASYWQEQLPLVKELLPQAQLFLFEEAGCVQGFIGLVDAHIAGIFVAQNKQSKGIGAQLLARAKQEHKTLSLQVYQQNSRAQAFYLREGFTQASACLDEATGEVELLLRWTRGEALP